MDIGKAIDGLFKGFVFALISTLILALYILWVTFFESNPWDVCGKMKTDSAKVQCMETHYD